MEVLVDNEPLETFPGPGEQGHEHERWTYIVAAPGVRYSLRFDNLAGDAGDLVVQIRIDGMSPGPAPMCASTCLIRAFAAATSDVATDR